MRIAYLICTFVISIGLFFSCGSKPKEMTLTDYLKIDTEIATTDQKPETMDAVAKKYGYTLKQYQEFSEKVESDPALKEKLGELRLGEMKEKQKK